MAYTGRATARPRVLKANGAGKAQSVTVLELQSMLHPRSDTIRRGRLLSSRYGGVEHSRMGLRFAPRRVLERRTRRVTASRLHLERHCRFKAVSGILEPHTASCDDGRGGRVNHDREPTYPAGPTGLFPRAKLAAWGHGTARSTEALTKEEARRISCWFVIRLSVLT